VTQEQHTTTVLHAPDGITAGATTYLPNGAQYEARDTPAGVAVNVSAADVEAMTAHGYSAETATPSSLPTAASAPSPTQPNGQSTLPPLPVPPQNAPLTPVTADPVATTAAVLVDPPAGAHGS